MATLHYKPNFIFSDPGLVTRASKVRVAGAFAFLLLGAFLFGVVLTQVGFCQIHSLLIVDLIYLWSRLWYSTWVEATSSLRCARPTLRWSCFFGLDYFKTLHILRDFNWLQNSSSSHEMQLYHIYEVNCSGSHLLDAIFTLYITYQSIQDLYLFNLSIPIVPQEDSQKLQSVLKFHLIICCWFPRLNSWSLIIGPDTPTIRLIRFLHI